MKVTPYFLNSVLPRRPYLDVQVCEEVIASPIRQEEQDDGRMRYWGKVGEKWLRVVVDDGALHNAFYDRSFKP